jgi:hypothetical protein
MEMLVDIAIPIVVIMMMFQGFTCRVERPRESPSIRSSGLPGRTARDAPAYVQLAECHQF